MPGASIATDTGDPTCKGPFTCVDGAAAAPNSSPITPAKSTSSKGKGLDNARVGMGPGAAGFDDDEKGAARYRGVGRPW